MRRALKVLKWTGIVVVVLVVVFLVAVYGTTFHPDAVQPETVTCRTEAPEVPAGASLKVMTWNVQFMAGTDYIFWWELPNGTGPDERPAAAAIARTLDEVARVIMAEQPDLVLLQEVDDGAARTDEADQLALLLGRLPATTLPCHTSAFYWKASFLPHPRIWGSVGMKLSTLSRYKITSATRVQLAEMSNDPVTRAFSLKRAVLAASLPIQAGAAGEGGQSLTVINTHLDAFAQGDDTMSRQVAEVKALVDELKGPWVMGGDFNLLADSSLRATVEPEHQFLYNTQTELTPLINAYRSVPSRQALLGESAALWATHRANTARAATADRAIDYLFLSTGLGVGTQHVRQHDTMKISDHLPVLMEVQLVPQLAPQ